jgi:propanol-preferring alcohol dehydrogenase
MTPYAPGASAGAPGWRRWRRAVVRGFQEPLTLEQVPHPELTPDQIRVEACELCHTDIHAARGDWPVKPQPPFIPVH